MDDLEELITYARKALALCPLDHPDRPYSLSNLAVAVRTRYHQFGEMKDLEEAITCLREALGLCPPGDPDRPRALINLATSVQSRYDQFGRTKDLEEVILFLREALTLCPPGDPDRSHPLSYLGTAVYTRYEQSGRLEDLEEAITYHREALNLCPPGDPDRPRALNNLATSVQGRYEQFGRMEDLEEGITYHLEALTFRPPGHSGRSSSLNNLASAVLARYEQFGRIEDLEEGITYHREALTLKPIGDPDRSSSLNNLASAVHTRYEQFGRMEDLEEGIAYHREALTLRPPGHPDRFFSLNNLAILVLDRKQSVKMKDLEEAVTSHREALNLCPPDHPAHCTTLNNLACAVLIRYEQSNSMEDLEEGIACFRKVLPLRPPGHLCRASSLHNLASAVLTRYKQSGGIEDLDESFMLYEHAVNDMTASSKDRLTAAIRWAKHARDHHRGSVIRAYSMSLHLLDRSLIFHLDIGSQQKFLATANIPRSLASDAASAAIDAKEFETAVELLEQGRAILWSKLKGFRPPLDPLRHVNSQLADKLQKVGIQLEQLALSSKSRQMGRERSNLEIQMRSNRILSAEWENLVGQIQEIEGFRNFLQAVPFPTLRMAAAEGPVIVINISHYRSDAIIIQIDNSPTLVPLPNVQPNHLIYLDEQLALALHPNTPRAKRPAIIRAVLRDLWNDIVSPVCDRLAQLGVPQGSRIWWCPTSLLCALPLHAAGLYETKKANFKLPDIYISSYTPTLSALIGARSNIVTGQSISPKLLVIGQPDIETLKNVQDEINDIQQFGDFVDVMVGADASRDTVLHCLQQHSWAHFACHGHLGDNSQPFHASFQLYDNSRLSLLDLIHARLPNAEFAFLASCHSAAGDPKTPDETIHLAAALQFCGFRSVVGTLWEMADKAGPIVSKKFYDYMFRNSRNKADIRDSAKGLNLAVRELRKRGAPLDCWILFVHIGA